MKFTRLNVDYMQMFVMISNVGIAINTGVNVKNSLIKVGVIMDLFGILAHVNVNVVNCAL